MPCLKNKNCTKKENNTKYNRCDKDKLTDKKWYIMYYITCKSHDFSKKLERVHIKRASKIKAKLMTEKYIISSLS